METFKFSKIFEHLLYNPEDPLLFNSAFFLFFLLAFLFLFLKFHQDKQKRVLLFTAFSLYFFYKACGYYVALVLISAVVDFNISRWIYEQKDAFKKKFLLVFSIVINLALLFYFKYTDFFIGILNDYQLGEFEPLNLILPIGISFYTFENISYTVDVYRGHFKPINSFMDYVFFLSFFPKLIMGPIVRAADFIPQISKEYKLTNEALGKGFYLIIAGLFKKVVISDYIYVNFVQYIFDDPSKHIGLECWLAVYGYALVIYCDFSGYSDMAIGIGKWMGFDININFLSPYQSASITEFWRRWHISLSSWLRDYLYIPLGGNKHGKIRQNINLAITMLIGGFWHGANWTFIFWGALHGFALGFDKIRMYVTEQILGERIENPTTKKMMHVLGVLFTFHFVCFTWIFFKASSFSDALVILDQIWNNFQGAAWPDLYATYKSVLLVMLMGFGLHFISLKKEEEFSQRFIGLPNFTYAMILVVFILLLAQVKTAEQVMPIYLQF
jgi:D-alanyl-lipoteichoic acid acyltransferase DltB (MBOAT superfamily)